MAVMRTVGVGHTLPPHAHVREEDGEYVIELDVSDFTQRELSVEALGPRVTVRGNQAESDEDDSKAFRLRERLEESFRLPDDADTDQLTVFYRHGSLEIHAPRLRLEPRPVPIENGPTHLIRPDATGC